MKNIKSAAFIVILLVILFLYSDICVAGPIAPEIKSVVCFVFIEKETKLVPNGTAFFVALKNPSKPTSANGYLVTAKHVLYKPDTTEFLNKIYIRLNKKAGGSEVGMIPIQTQGDNQNVFLHPDSSVDLAVIPLFPDQEKFDLKFLPEEFITTQKDYTKLQIRGSPQKTEKIVR